jgi:hypothetical protein
MKRVGYKIYWQGMIVRSTITNVYELLATNLDGVGLEARSSDLQLCSSITGINQGGNTIIAFFSEQANVIRANMVLASLN